MHPTPQPQAARLLIQARPMDAALTAGQGWVWRRVWRQVWRRLTGLGPWPGGRGTRPARPPALVRIDDLQGRRFFTSEDARACIDLPLPAGTYHVTVRLGELQRRYTVVLEQGATVRLDLPLAQDFTAVGL
jgi:hypothetical protein